jgi:tetratricopeptide (TPR) repeat protein
MASLIPGYEYDIFISYRQKDNKHDGWVTKFVENLKGELESTFKEDISIYFDENPHDRLQETYNVNKSLEGKLKCLIFIPILSQTYCDPASYAWQNEFLAFIRLTDDDRFGKDVRLKSGNVASRILPIRIHDLEPEDVKLFEKETGTVLRAIDFVFKTSAGVNRPLMANEDHPNDNLNKTFYRDQINKAANTIKEIIVGLKSELLSPVQGKNDGIRIQEQHLPVDQPVQEKQANPARLKILTGVFGTALLLLIIVFAVFPKIFTGSKNKIAKDPDGRISIVVNNFENNTNDTTLNWLKMGIPELLRNNLTGSNELSVQNSRTMSEIYETIGQTKNVSMAPTISREAAVRLKAGTYITGSFQKYGNNILALVKLIDTKSEELLWTGQSEGDLQSIRFLADSLSTELKNFLEIKALKQKTRQEFGDALTRSSEAYRKYIEGMHSMMKSDWRSALASFLDAYKIDSTSVLAAFNIALAYDGLAVDEDSKYRRQAALWTQNAYNNREKLSRDHRLWIEMWHAFYNTKNTNDVLKYCSLLEESDIKSRHFWHDIGMTYMIFSKPEKAMKIYEKIEKISSDWGEEWGNQSYFYHYANSCHLLGIHDREEKILENGIKLFSDAPTLEWLRIRCAISTGDSARAKVLMNERLKDFKEAGRPASMTEQWSGNLYESGNAFDKAEEKYRRAIQIDPSYDLGKFYLAKFLIKNDRNVDEGMNLLNDLAKKFPDNWDYNFYYIKSIGLLKQGKFSAADSLIKILSDSTYTASIEMDNLKKVVRDSLNRKN